METRFHSLQVLLLLSTRTRLPDTYIHLKRMRSFTLSLIATITFAAFSVAAPVPSAAAVSTSSITNGTADLSTVPGILTSVNAQLTPIQEKLRESRSHFVCDQRCDFCQRASLTSRTLISSRLLSPSSARSKLFSAMPSAKCRASLRTPRLVCSALPGRLSLSMTLLTSFPLLSLSVPEFFIFGYGSFYFSWSPPF